MAHDEKKKKGSGPHEEEAESVAPVDGELAGEQGKALEAAIAEADDLRSKLIRWQADFQNLQRRAAREVLESRQRAEEDFAKSLLLVLDHFDMALNVDPGKVDAGTLLNGVKMTYDELKKVLAKRGIVSFDPTGQAFDPHQHEAVMQEKSEQHPPMTVIQTFVPGYKSGELVLRPAKVKVSSQ